MATISIIHVRPSEGTCNIMVFINCAILYVKFVRTCEITDDIIKIVFDKLEKYKSYKNAIRRELSYSRSEGDIQNTITGYVSVQPSSSTCTVKQFQHTFAVSDL